MSSLNPSMEDLPLHLMLDILSKLPVKTVISCKCVCKKWWNLVSDSYFANLHLSSSPEGLLIHDKFGKSSFDFDKPGVLKLCEIEDEPDHHKLQHDPVMSLDLKLADTLKKSQLLPMGSVNGLICLWQSGPKDDNTYICNPITREYMILPRQHYYRKGYAVIVYGFGVSLKTKEYKVVRTFQGNISPDPIPTEGSRPRLLEAEIYTLGTGHWRSLGHVPYWCDGYDGPFLKGHAHWTVIDNDSPEKLCAFDFDNETFQLFPSPPYEAIKERQICFTRLGVLKGCLCRADTFDSQFMIWVMKEYGVKKSWHKEVVIKETGNPHLDWVLWEPIYVIKGLKDGTILMVYNEDQLLAYCPRRKTIEGISHCDLSGMAYRPSFIKLHNFKSEKVHVFRDQQDSTSNTHRHFYIKQ